MRRESVLPPEEGGSGLSFHYHLQLFGAVGLLHLQPSVTHVCRSHEADHRDMCVTGIGNASSDIRVGFFWPIVPLSMQSEQIRKAR